MEHINDYSDCRNKSWCIHCGNAISAIETNFNHVPSKTFLQKPYPSNLPKVEVCIKCNNSFSKDEEYCSIFLNCVINGSTNPENHANTKIARALKRSEKLQNRIDRSKVEYKTHGGETCLLWKPEAKRLNHIALKNARGHAYYEFGEPMLTEPTHAWFSPLECLSAEERTNFESSPGAGLWPEVGSRMMDRMITGKDLAGGWVVVQEGKYRYCVAQHGLMLVRSVIFDYLATEVYWSS